MAASTPSETRKHFAIHALAGSEPVSHAAKREGVSRQFIYRQKHKAEAALNQAFSPAGEASDVLFQAWFKNSLFWVTQAQRIHPSKLQGEMGSS